MSKMIGKTLDIKRGDVVWVIFDPTEGTETKKTRPAVILSNNLFNQYLPRLIVAPITSNIEKQFEFDALVFVGKKQGKAMLDQIRAIDKKRLGKKIGTLTFDELKSIERALKCALALL